MSVVILFAQKNRSRKKFCQLNEFDRAKSEVRYNPVERQTKMPQSRALSGDVFGLFITIYLQKNVNANKYFVVGW